MDDQLFSLFKSVSSGMNQRQRDEVIEILRNPPTGRTPADLVQFLDLKRIIDELTRLSEAYRKRDWRDIDGNRDSQVMEFQKQYLRLHREIVGYFDIMSLNRFSKNGLDYYDSIQKRIVLEDKLTERRGEIQRMWDFYHEVAALPNQIRQLPAFNLQKAEYYGKALVVRKTGESGEVTENIMNGILNRGSDDDSEYLHGKWFLARLFFEQQPQRIKALTEEADNFKRTFQKATNSERNALTAFKRNQDPVYFSQNYQVAYNEWCIDRFNELRR